MIMLIFFLQGGQEGERTRLLDNIGWGQEWKETHCGVSWHEEGGAGILIRCGPILHETSCARIYIKGVLPPFPLKTGFLCLKTHFFEKKCLKVLVVSEICRTFATANEKGTLLTR